jgi:hypothetical protein
MLRYRNNLKYILLLLTVILLTACGKSSTEGKILVVIGENSKTDPDFISGKEWRYTAKSHLAVIDAENATEPSVLTSGFYSACSPSVSYDGTRILFAARKEQADPWQIWEMELGNHKVTQITDSRENSIDPVYLPGGKIVFSRMIENDSLKSGHSIFSCNLDGSGLTRLTFNPETWFAPVILKDGRIVAISRQVYPDKGVPDYMVLRPDGTKCELFYGENSGAELVGRLSEKADGSIFFTEYDKNISGKINLVSISYRRPLHSKKVIQPAENFNFCSVSDYNDRNLLVTGKSANEKIALFEFDVEKLAVGKKLYEDGSGDVLEAAVIKAYQRPRKLPSEVDMGVKTGLLLCQNINMTGLKSPEKTFDLKNADRVEIIGVDSSLGVIKVQKDGSVYLKIAADTPFRIKTLDKDHNVIGGPGTWLYLRPNERRGCVGCHEDQEIAPANRYALAVGRNPVSVPVHYSGIKEKEVELE